MGKLKEELGIGRNGLWYQLRPDEMMVEDVGQYLRKARKKKQFSQEDACDGICALVRGRLDYCQGRISIQDYYAELLRRQYHLSLLQAFQREFPHVPECKGIPDKYRFLYKNLSNPHQYIPYTHFSSHFQPSTPNRPEAFRAICTETFPGESVRYHKMQFVTE